MAKGVRVQFIIRFILIAVAVYLAFAAVLGLAFLSMIWKKRNNVTSMIECPMCNGAGWRDDDVCPLCDGESSLVTEHKKLKR